MKKSILIIKSLMVMTALFMVSCNTDDSINCPEPITGELNAIETEFSGSWALSGMMAEDAVDMTDDTLDNPSKNIYEQYTACRRDVIYNFMANRSYTDKKGYAASDCKDKLELTGTWGLTDGKTLRLIANCGSQMTQITVDETGKTFSFVTPATITDIKGVQKATKITYTYTKKVEIPTP